MVWHQLHAAGELRAERDSVAARLARLRPNSHRAVELRAELRQLTSKLLKMEQTIRGGDDIAN